MNQSKRDFVQSKKWKRLGNGNYNIVYLDSTEKYVLKVQRTDSNKQDRIPDMPERSVRLWNELNPDLEYPAFIVNITEESRGWVCPFIKGNIPDDQEVSDCLIDIFNKTSRIVLDAPVFKNFIKTKEGKVVCIDVGLLLEMEQRDKVVYKGGAVRRRSVDSRKVWNYVDFSGFFKKAAPHAPKTTNTIHALLFIKKHRPNIVDASYLKKDSTLINTLAKAYLNPDYQAYAFTYLDKFIPSAQVTYSLNLQNTRERCIEELKKYINSRGTEDNDGKFMPSFVTRWFRDSTLTRIKVEYAKDLINQLEDTRSVDEMTKFIKQIKESPNALASKYTSGLEVALSNCLRIVEENERDLAPSMNQ